MVINIFLMEENIIMDKNLNSSLDGDLEQRQDKNMFADRLILWNYHCDFNSLLLWSKRRDILINRCETNILRGVRSEKKVE